ncbi:growth-regulating factor 9-like [Solanum verrucosum]|uniref:growth-regulating factor 9-like n=1 Tax=Solanum verrucosum TaxID=315347 RepID=UPI0020D15013|nr:growth-regulating factor 9-like [Solanum verrucosum]
MQLHLFSATPLSLSGKGKEDEIKKKEGSPPCIELSLGYGSSSHVVEEDEKDAKSSNSLFTAAQFQELQLQAVIFKYLVSGLPVPFHLFFIIWNSVSSSLGDGGIYKLYPTLGRFDYTSMTDPEPGRCRRTDGKKWRCKRDVIPGQKYCGQHVHRGRRSRKPVESSEHVMRSDDTNIISKITKLYASSDDPGSKCAPASSKTSCLSSTSRSNQYNSIEDSSVKPRFINSINGSEKQDNYMICNRKDITTSVRTPSFISGDNADTKNIDFNRISPSKTNQKQNCGEARKHGALVPIFGLSTKSDLQHSIGSEADQQRCRRSDGKKWRCSKTVVPCQKYCETHMHRGANRKRVASVSVVVPPSKPPSYRFCPPENDGTRRNLNTSLSIYTIPGRQNITDDDSNSNSISDATTITDEIPAFVSH